ncbi:MAG: hypothetical protein JXM70_17270, partial [Pirellulales bacterium]|nr:hypothetical protein [Pirellulales bacterium]
MPDKVKTSENPQKQDAGSSRRRLVPPIWIIATVVVLILLPFGVRIGNLIDSNFGVNLLTVLGFFLTFVVLLLWFLLFSGYRFRTRLFVLAAFILAGIASGLLFKIDNFSGDLVPTFAFRWTPPADELLKVPDPSKSREDVDLLTTTENDFPQFLGPNRDLRAKVIALDHDWDRNAPKCLWRRPIGAGWSSFVVVNGFAVTLEQRGELEMV